MNHPILESAQEFELLCPCHATREYSPLQGVDETPLTYIDTLPALKELAGELASASEVAVDLEAHSYRSFQGFCCLMQLSTRRADYLVDVLALRSFIGPCLGPVFADAKARPSPVDSQE